MTSAWLGAERVATGRMLSALHWVWPESGPLHEGADIACRDHRLCSRPRSSVTWPARHERRCGLEHVFRELPVAGLQLREPLSSLHTDECLSRLGVRPRRAIRRANVDRLQATVTHARPLFRLLKCPVSPAGRHPATPG